MLCTILCCKNYQDKNGNDQYILSYDEPNLCNDYISKEHSRNNHFCINFLRHCFLGHALSDIGLLNDVNSWKEVVEHTKKPRSVDPYKLKPIQTSKKTTTNKKICQKNRESRSVTIHVPKVHRNKSKEPRSGSTQCPEKPRSERTQKDPMNMIFDIEESRSGDKDSTPQRMASVAGHPKNRLYMDSSASLHILFNKELMGGI